MEETNRTTPGMQGRRPPSAPGARHVTLAATTAKPIAGARALLFGVVHGPQELASCCGRTTSPSRYGVGRPTASSSERELIGVVVAAPATRDLGALLDVLD